MSKDTIIKWVLGLVGTFLVAAVGFLLTLPTSIALTDARLESLADQVDATLEVIDALHPRGSARAGGELVKGLDARAAKLRDLMRRAPGDDDDTAAGPPAVCAPCPPCPTQTPTPEVKS